MSRKLTISAVLLALIVVFVTFAGRSMIERSGVFDAAQSAVRDRFGVAGGALRLRWFAPFQFSEGATSGKSSFTLVRDERCYPIDALVDSGKWTVTVRGEIKC